MNVEKGSSWDKESRHSGKSVVGEGGRRDDRREGRSKETPQKGLVCCYKGTMTTWLAKSICSGHPSPSMGPRHQSRRRAVPFNLPLAVYAMPPGMISSPVAALVMGASTSPPDRLHVLLHATAFAENKAEKAFSFSSKVILMKSCVSKSNSGTGTSMDPERMCDFISLSVVCRPHQALEHPYP